MAKEEVVKKANVKDEVIAELLEELKKFVPSVDVHDAIRDRVNAKLGIEPVEEPSANVSPR